jgi:hypothetical protein
MAHREANIGVAIRGWFPDEVAALAADATGT